MPVSRFEIEEKRGKSRSGGLPRLGVVSRFETEDEEELTPAQKAARTRGKNALDEFMSGEAKVLPGHAELKNEALRDLLGDKERTFWEHAKGAVSPVEAVGDAFGDVKEMVGGLGNLMGMGFKGVYNTVRNPEAWRDLAGLMTGKEPAVGEAGRGITEFARKVGPALVAAGKTMIEPYTSPEKYAKFADEHPLYALMDVSAAASGVKALARVAGGLKAVQGSRLAKPLEKVSEFSVRKSADRGLKAVSPVYANWRKQAADRALARKLQGTISNAQYRNLSKDITQFDEMWSKLTTDEQRQFVAVSEGTKGQAPFIVQEGEVVRNPAVSDNLFQAVEKRRAIVGDPALGMNMGERGYLSRLGAIKPETMEAVDWQPLMAEIAQERGLIGRKWRSPTGSRKAGYDLITYDKLDETTRSELLREAQIRTGWLAPKKVKTLEPVKIGEREVRVTRTITETVPATAKKQVKYERYKKEVDFLAEYTDKAISDFIDRRYAPFFTGTHTFEDKVFPGALSNKGLTTQDIRNALQKREGKAWETMKRAAEEELTEGYKFADPRTGRTELITDSMEEMDEFDPLFRDLMKRKGKLGKSLESFGLSEPVAPPAGLPKGRPHTWTREQLENNGYIPVFFRAGSRGRLPEGMQAGDKFTVRLKPGSLHGFTRENTGIIAGYVHKSELPSGAGGDVLDSYAVDPSRIIVRGGIKTGQMQEMGKLTEHADRALDIIPRAAPNKPGLPAALQALTKAPAETPAQRLMVTQQRNITEAKKIPITEDRYVEKVIYAQNPEGWKPIYVPHAFEAKMAQNPSRFSQFYAQQGMPRNERLPFLKKRKGVGGYVAEDPTLVRQVMVQHAAQARRNEATHELARTLREKFAQPYDGTTLLPDHVEWHWEQLLRTARVQENVSNIFFRHIGEALGASTKAGKGALRAVIKESDMMGALKKTMLDALDDPAMKEFLTVRKNTDRMQVPKWVAKQMDDFAGSPNAGVYLLWDIPTQAWKYSVLTQYPRWAFNDFFGALVFNTIAGVTPRDYWQMMKGMTSKMAGEAAISPKKIMNIPGARGLARKVADYDFLKKWEEAVPYNRTAESLTQTELRGRHPGATLEHPVVGPILRAGQAVIESRAAKYIGRPLLYPFELLGNTVKWVDRTTMQAMRSALYLNKAKKLARGAIKEKAVRGAVTEYGRADALLIELKRMKADLKDLDPRMSAEDLDYFSRPVAEEALDHVNYFLNDWNNAMTRWERRTVARVIPFWSWARHVINLSRKLPFDYPGRTEVMRGLALAANNAAAEEDSEYLPAWVRHTFKLGESTRRGAEGEKVNVQKRLRTTSVNPFNTLVETGEALGLSGSGFFDFTHPFVQAVLGTASGTDIRTGRPLRAPGIEHEFVSGNYYDPGRRKGPLERPVPAGDVLFPALFKSFPQMKYLDLLRAGGRTYDTSNPLGKSQPILDPKTGKPMFPIDWGDEMLRWLGPSITTVEDLPEQIERNKAGELRAGSRRFNRLTENEKKRRQAMERIGRYQNQTP